MTARKVMLLGDIGVGKSSIVQRLVFDRFDLSYKPTIGVDVYRYEVADAGGGQPLSLIIWDTDGNFGDSIFRHVYMKQSSAAVIVGDVTRQETIDSMLLLASGFEDAFPGRQVALLFNKVDLLRPGEDADVPPALAGYGRGHYCTSAKTGLNVKDALHATAAAILRRGQ